MVDASVPKVPLGVANLVGEAFSLFFRRLHVVALISFVPYFVFTLIQYSVVGIGGPVDPVTGETNWIAFAVTTLVGMAVFGIVSSMLTEAAYDAKLSRPPRLTSYFLSGLRRLLPVVVLTIAASVAVGLGFAALIVPGLWLMAVFSIVVPVIVVENAGFRGLSRSSSLTKGYRWPIVGFFTLILFIFFAITTVFTIIGFLVPLFLFGPEFTNLPEPGAGLIVGVAFFAAVANTLTYGYLGMATVLLYARLREVKEGISVEQIADVFA